MPHGDDHIQLLTFKREIVADELEQQHERNSIFQLRQIIENCELKPVGNSASQDAKHRWTQRWQSNFYYGYSNVDSTPLMSPTAGDTIHNGGVNLIWSPRPGFGIGLEYDYGLREVANGIMGSNHRIQFAIQFGP